MSPASTAKYKQLLSSRTVGQNKFRKLNQITWINLAKPRIIKIGKLEWDPSKATALIKPNHLQEFIPMLSENSLTY